MNKRNIIITIVAVLLILAVGGFYVMRQASASRTTSTAGLQTADITRGSLIASVNAAGTIASPQTATLVWQTDGVVGKVAVAVGDKVKAGDVLLELDPASVNHTVTQAQADLLNAQQALATLLAGSTDQQMSQAKLTLVQARQAVTTAERNLKSVMNPAGQSLHDAVAAAQLAYDTAQANGLLENVSADANQLQSTQNSMNTSYSQLQRAQNAYDDCVKINCAEFIQRQNSLTGAQNAYQAAVNNYQAALLTYNTKVNNLSSSTGTAKGALTQAQANLAAAQAGPDPAKVALYQAQLDVANANAKQAQTDLDNLKNSPTAADVTAARAKIATAQAIVNDTRQVAPFSGTVVAVYNRVGDSVATSQTALALADLSALQIQVDVSEVDINRIAVGQDVTLTADAASGATFTGQVSDVSVMGKSAQGVVTFPVTVVVPQPDPALKPGMTAAVAIATDKRDNVLLIPNRAIRTSGGQRTVTVLFEGQKITVPVTLGLSNETYTELVEGALKEGDAVVTTTTTTTTSTGGGGLFGLFGGGGRGP